MPYEQPSPVAPETSSRLWTAGASGGVAVLVLLGMAVADPHQAGPLLIGAGLVVLCTWLVSRRSRLEGPLVEESDPAGERVEDAPSPQLLAGALDALNDPVLVVSGGEIDDIAGRRVVMANRAARDLLKINQNNALLVSLIRSPEVLEAVDEALFGGVSRTTDYLVGGVQTRHWRALTRPIAAPDGAPTALLALRDETDSRRMELMRVDFLANASHELRTPLASLSGFIETLKGHAREDPAARDRFLDIMSIQAERMGRLVADLLSLSRIELNEHVPPSGRVDLARVVTDVVDAVTLLSQERGVTFEVDVSEGPAMVTGDRDELMQVVQNLVDNAVKYSQPGHRVEIRLTADASAESAAAARMDGAFRLSLLTPDREQDARYAVVSVRDYGPGMAREHLPRLAERFYRVEGQKSGERPGTGLGLAIVKHITNRHRGGVAVESALGEGTVFSAYFPKAPATRLSPTPPTT